MHHTMTDKGFGENHSAKSRFSFRLLFSRLTELCFSRKRKAASNTGAEVTDAPDAREGVHRCGVSVGVFPANLTNQSTLSPPAPSFPSPSFIPKDNEASIITWEANKKSRIDATRIDAKDIIDELFEGISLPPPSQAPPTALQSILQKPTTTTTPVAAGTASMTWLRASKKKYRFLVNLRVEELQYVPLEKQVLSAKVRLRDGGFRGHAPRMEVTEHAVRWGSCFTFQCRMAASAATGELDSCLCRVTVRREVRGGKASQKLGYADVNLAQFAGCRGSQRYLLQAHDAKTRMHNSLLKVTVNVALLCGDPCFKAPSPRGACHQSPAQDDEEPARGPRGPTSGCLASRTSPTYEALRNEVLRVLGE